MVDNTVAYIEAKRSAFPASGYPVLGGVRSGYPKFDGMMFYKAKFIY